MQSLKNKRKIFVSKALSAYYTAVTRVTAGKTEKTQELPKAPEDFSPVIRFAVCSDIHISGKDEQIEEARLKKLIDFMYEYSEKQPYGNFDALCVAGDMTNGGRNYEYDAFNRVIKESLKPETKLLICTGNHEYIEYRAVDASQGARMFERKMKKKQDTHEIINGYHFVLTSYCEDGKTFKEKLKDMDIHMLAATKVSAGKPVFTFQHPAPQGTVYGSVAWGDRNITKVYRKYPGTINFSGHSHYPINDPRSLWQSTFTALGCGTLKYFETDLDGFSGNFPYEISQAAQFYIVEGDEKGNVRVLSYDLITDSFFDNEYYFTDLYNKNFPYSYAKMKRRDSKPQFEDSEISVMKNEDDENILRFKGAKDNFVTESYKVTLRSKGIVKKSFSFSGKYMYKAEPDVYEVNLGKLSSGSYTVHVNAMNAYAKLSDTLKHKFTV